MSKGDALAARLRFLRSQTSSCSDGGPQPPPASPHHDVPGTAAQPPEEPSAAPCNIGVSTPEETAVSQAPPRLPTAPIKAGSRPVPYDFLEADAEDEDALDELLESLADEHFDLAADLESEVAPPPASSGNQRDNVSSKDDDDDDSDGEQMSRAVEQVLSQITDEMKSLPPSTAPVDKDDGEQQPETQPGTGPGNENRPTDPKTAATEQGSDLGASFTLPSVPSQLVDPAPESTGEDDFEKDISTRLASLRGLGSVDALGLPSAPTFRPEDRSLGNGLLKSSKYTDEDQKTWCVVCLEDAAVRCIGCENDVYCARCWREMHVGPAAGYDERGHQWVKFERRGNP